MDLGLAGLVFFVTGASGGIGAEIVSALRGEGALVAAHSRRGVAEDGGTLSVLGDVRDPGATARAMEQASARFGRVDACVANAGIWPADALELDAMPEARVREVVETNLLGAMWTARAFFAALKAHGPRADGRGASVTFIGSTAGRFGEPGHAEYAATKAALVGLTRSWKNEIVKVDPRARVNLVEPGWTATEMAAEALAASGAIARVTKTMPLQQIATPRGTCRERA
jgi:3-oxoacyl-[acyl-carrier protein] reductase